MQEEGQYIGAVVQVYSKEPAQGGMLENVSVRQLGNRYFVVGTLASRDDGTDDTRIGCPFWFALDDVYMLTEFPSIDAARARYSAHKESHKE